ncbi:MAG: YggS family pyridoxal phosphate-dependent enzyme [Tannerellaceae bacterium]|jgi:pyridoxal phosphate enzyme (YggS family)|nr:YggS family pyridoxal phosphate-dependent enzyme [Tannerellaceae bacterium]
MSVAENVRRLRSAVPDTVSLVAVSKYQPVEAIRQAYDAGQRLFGENRAQELVAKYPLLPSDIEWHFIGTLQINKVKHIAPFVHTIHSIDSLALLDEVNRQAIKKNRLISVFLQIHLAQENTKHGFSPAACLALLRNFHPADYPAVRIDGLMCMATFTDDTERIRGEFRQLRVLFDTIRADFFPDKPHFRHLSMGMSHDYPIAIEEGATMVRIGTAIFGGRPPVSNRQNSTFLQQ